MKAENEALSSSPYKIKIMLHEEGGECREEETSLVSWEEV